MSEDIRVCRTCLRSDKLAPIFARAEHHERYTVALFLTTGLQVECNDGLPQTICWDCTELVNSALHFRNQCHRSELQLHRLGFQTRTRKRNKSNDTARVQENDALLTLERETDGRDTKNEIKVEMNSDSMKEEQSECVRSEMAAVSERTDVCAVREFVDTTNFNGGNLYDVFKRRYSDDDSNFSAGYISDQNHIVKASVPRRTTKRSVRKPARTNGEKRALLMSLVEGPFDPKGPIQCKICKRSVGRWSSFRSHCKLHLGFDFVCEYCGKSFISITQLRRHKGSKHGEARTLACQRCGYRALDKPQLILHERREHTGERPFICDACGASYYSRRCLIQHIENHSTARTIQCDQCPSMFKSRRHLARHTYGCHASGAYSYRCHVCQQLFKKLKYARRHMHKMHGLTTQQQGTVAKVKL